jgi:hypothetical protein
VRRALAGLALLALALPASARAHVEVLPSKPLLEQEQEFIVRVPDERDVPTTGVRVVFPKGVNVSQFAPLAGWRRKILLTRDRRPRGVVYTGGRIAPEEYAEFRFLATPRRAGPVVWKTFQTYADGATKPWTGPPEKPGAKEEEETGPTEQGPAPATEVTTVPDVVPAGASTSAKAVSSDAAIWLGVIAIVIALGAALAAGFLWSTRPAALPADEPEDLVEDEAQVRPGT